MRASFLSASSSCGLRRSRRTHLESANLRRLAAGTGRGEAGIAVVHVAVVDAHAVRIGIGGRRERHDLQHLARVRIDLLNQMVAGEQAPRARRCPNRARAGGRRARRACAGLRKSFGSTSATRLDAERRDPQRLGLRDERDAVHAAAPEQLMDLDGLARLQIGLNHFAERLVGRTRRTPSADAAVGAQPQVTRADGHAARVVRFGLHFMQHLARLPVDFEDALRHLIADPQAVGRRFERVGVNIGRLEQPLDLGLRASELPAVCGRLPARARQRRRDHPGDQRRRRCR